MATFSSYKNILVNFAFFCFTKLVLYVPQGWFLKANKMCHFSWSFKKINRQWLTYCYENFRWTWRKTRLEIGASLSATSGWESELVLWHKDSVYTSALLYMDSHLSEKLKHVQTLNVYLLRAQSGKLESAQQAANLHFEAVERKKSSLSRSWSLCVVPFVMTDGWRHSALRDWWQIQTCWLYPSERSLPRICIPKGPPWDVHMMPQVQSQLSCQSCTASSSIITC